MKTNQQFFKVMSKFRAGILLPALLFLMAGNAWASTSKTYYATMNVAATGSGTVYVNASGTTSQTKSTSSTSSSASISFNIYATANAGYKFSSWSGSGITFGSATTANTTGAISSSSTSSPGTSKTATASFVAIEATAAPANVTLSPTDPSATYPENTDERTLTFTTTSNNALTDFTYSPANGANGKYTFANWRRVDATHVAVDYTFSGGGNYGGLTRVHQVNVTLKGKEHATTQTCTITATFPNAKIIDGSAETIYATYKAADATQDGVEKTAVFNVENVDGINNFDTPTFTGTDAARFSLDPTTPMSYADGKLTVKYIYNGNKETTNPTHTATLTLKVNDAIGGTDATYGSKSITVTAYNEEEATEDVSVTTAANVTTNYATFAAGLAAANASAGCTLKLLRNVDLGTITTTNNITKAMTIDLNGKTLKAAVDATSVGILTITQAVAVTIRDSKTGGKIINEVARNSEIRTIFVNKAGATLTLESGTLAVNNTGQYASVVNASNGATAVYKSCSARVIHQVAGSTVNINGGRIEAYGTRSVYGILQASTAATNKAGTTVLNITGGEIYAEGPYSIMGVYAYGKVNFSGGTITAHVNTNMADAGYAADATQNKYNGYGYGIYLYPVPNATATSCYAGILNMTGGTINVTNDREYNGNYPCYGVLFGASAANVSSATAFAADGKSRGQIASATGSITGGEINVTSGTQYSYGVYVAGSYNSYDNTNHVVQIKNCKITSKAYVYAYGVNAYAAINSTNGACYAGDVELTNCDIYAESLNTSTAAAVWATATSTTIYKDGTTANAATWGGEFAVAGKAVINNGKYEAKTKTTSAFGAGTSSRAKTTWDAETTVAANRKRGGVAEAYPTLIIHGGTFKATSTTTTARGVSNGGYCTIDGGEFDAYATTTTAQGLYCLSGKLTASGVKVTASATGNAYGAMADVSIPSYSSYQTGFAMAGELELNNCDITATTRTSTEARGVFVNATNKLHNRAQFHTDSASGKWAEATTAWYHRSVFPCHVEGRDSIGISIAAKATINGGEIKATAATTTAYGIYAVGSQDLMLDSIAIPELTVKNAKITVTTNGTTGATGIYTQGETLVDGCDITVTPKTTTGYGIQAIAANDAKVTVKNTKITVNATTTAYGLYGQVDINAKNGQDRHGNFVLEDGNDVTANATGGNTSYAVFLKATKRAITAPATTPTDISAYRLGDYANAATAVINGGKYKATATGTTAYGIGMTAQQVQVAGSVVAQPECTVNGGKFWGKATGGTDGAVDNKGVKGHFVLNGGVYNVNTNLAGYIADGLEEVALSSDRPEYTEGYRYEIGEMGVHGGYVCQIGSNKYATLEEALQVVTSGQVIYMIDNYNMMTPGDYILPSGATLLIPYKTGTGAGATTAIGNSAKTNHDAVVPYLFRKLTFGDGVNLTCFGNIETSAEQKCNGQYAACVGMPSGAYGQIHLEEGSHISLESGARLNCWGYITGKGTINAKNGSTVLEGFQLGDWCGGTNASSLEGNSDKVFPITHYFYQSIECPITYRPGSSALGSTHIYASNTVAGQDGVKLVGTSGSLFLMDNKDASEDTWVMKDYDEETDQCVWTLNSGATLGNLSINMSAGWLSYNFESSKYDLPITTNMTVICNYGNIGVSQNTVFLPGSKMIVNKQGTFVVDNVNVALYDVDDWAGTKVYRASYSPTWGTKNPGSTTVPDVEFFLHGKVNIKGNGGIYTSAGGANVHSTNEDAGEVVYTTAAQGNKTSKYLQQGGTTRVALTVTPVQLKNGDGSYAASAGTAAGKTWTYKNDVWDAWSKDGCFLMDAQDKPHAKPAELVELTSKTPDAGHLHHDAATGTRNFVWDENCYWWEVSTTPTAEGYYLSLNADNNGKYNYYYYDGTATCWKIKTITVTWNINGNNTNYSVGYGTKPEWLGATPTKSSPSSDYALRWDGWTVDGGETVLSNDDLPVVTANTTFTAHFYEMYYQSLVTFKNDDGTVLESKLWNRGSMPSYEGVVEKAATAAQTFEFNGSWSPAITAVGSSPAEYVAQYTATTRKYTVTFVNYDMSVLGTTEVDYNTTPTTATYKAAIAPSDYEPYKPDNNAYSFEFDGWRLNGASSNGFVQVKGDQIYVAQFAETAKKYRITFVDEDGEKVLHWTQLVYDAMPSYDGPATSGFNKQDAEWNYTFTGWTPATFSQVKGPQTYTATYTTSKRSYTISFDSNGGSAVSSITNEWGSAVTAPADPTREGYTFNAWDPAVPGVMPTENMECVAQWNVVTYNLTYEGLNGATNSNPATYTVETPTITLADPGAREGYTFSGWTCGGSSITQIALGSTGDKVIAANFVTNTYQVSFAAGDGSGAAMANQNFTYGETKALSANTYTGPAATITYDYNGATGGNSPASETVNATFANWTDGVNSYDDEEEVSNLTATNGATVALTAEWDWTESIFLPTPTRTGYTFSAWEGEIGGMHLSQDAGDEFFVDESGTLTAQWTALTYYLTYEGLNGATNTNPATYTIETATITLADPGTREGYTFSGWTCGGSPITQIVVGSTGDKTITANWTLNAVTILWKSEDGSTTLETDEQVNIGDTPSFDGETPVKDATAQYTYTFDGWAAEANGAKVYEIDGLPDVTAAATYYAHFSSTVNNYTVSIVSNNTDYGTVDMASVATVPYGTVISTSANTINVNGTTVTATKNADNAQYTYTFDGWTNGTAAVEGNLTVTANFTRTTNTYTVTWKNYEGTVLETDENVAYGTTPVYNGATPTKPNDGTYDYAFTGWSPEVEDVTDNAIYTAQFVAVFPELDVVSAETLSMTATNTNTTIHESGILTIPDGMTLTTTNFIIKATTTTSGQLFADAANINAANAYFDLTLNAQTRTWYGVGVPWRVNAHYGIYGGADADHLKLLALGKDFDIIWYNGDTRASAGPVNACYEYLEDIGDPNNRIVEPGRMYFMFFARPYNVIRFKKLSAAPLVYVSYGDVERFTSEMTDETNHNWNGIANSHLTHMTALNTVKYAWRYKNVNIDANKTGQWELVTNFAGSKFVVGQPIMVQVPNLGSSEVWSVPAPDGAPLRKMAADGDIDRAEVVLTSATGLTDRILCVVSDEAKDEYTLGDDLVKFTNGEGLPQLWINNYKHALAVNTIRLEDNVANYPLTIVAPTTGDYRLSLVNHLAEGIHLYLTFNGEAIADLTEGEYTLSLGKETSKAYGLRLVRGPRGTVTGVDEALSGKENVEKVVMDGVLYIIRQGKVYDAQGKFIRLQ